MSFHSLATENTDVHEFTIDKADFIRVYSRDLWQKQTKNETCLQTPFLHLVSR